MSVWTKFCNLYRLNFLNQVGIVIYFFKTIFGLSISLKEKEIYTYYNYLIFFNGFQEGEDEKSLTTVFRRRIPFKMKLRKFPSSDLNVFQQVYFWKSYSQVIDCYRSHFKISGNALNIFDCGSNIGLTSLYFLESFPESKILAIEPEKENYNLLHSNLDNSTWSNVEKLNAAVWSSNCRTKILQDFRDKKDWSFRVEESNDEKAVDAFSIGFLMKKYKFDLIDILKIDIEGAEKELFTSPESNLDFLKQTKCLAIEIHNEFDCRTAIEKILTDNGFKLFNWSELTIGYNQNLTDINR